MTNREVRVVPHDPSWAAAFEAEAAALRSVLGDEALAVHHIGSTAIPDISAKPIVDLLVEVRRIEAVDALYGAIAERGYEAWGEYGLPGRRYFTKDRGDRRICNAHVYQKDNPGVERHLAFRDYMISHPETASAYAQLKEDLAQKFPADIEAYMDGKDPFIKQIESEALAWARAKRQEADKLRARTEGPTRAESGGEAGAC